MGYVDGSGGRDGGRIRRGIRRAFRLAAGGRVHEQVDDEIALHIELRARQLEGAGMTPAEARAEAERRFGAVDTSRRALRRSAAQREQRMRAREWLASVWYDVRQAARSLSRDRAMATVVVLTLALGVGANAGMFGVMDRLLFGGPSGLHDVRELGRLYVMDADPQMPDEVISTFSYATFSAFRERATSFAGMAAYMSVQEVTLGRGIGAEQVRVRYATSSLFPLLGARPALGRFFTASEEQPPEGERVAVLDYGTWQRRFGGDPGVLGRALVLGDREYTIVGVAPRGFTGPELQPVELWLPVSAGAPSWMKDWPTTEGARWLRVVARPAAGVTPEQGSAQVTAIYRSTHAERPPAAGATVVVRPLWFDQHGVEAPEVAVSRWLVGVSVALLLVACANVANLLLARGLRRRREIAVRLALGVSRARLVRLLLAEAALLAVAGGVAGLAVAYVGIRVLRLTLLDGMVWVGSSVDSRILAYTMMATAFTAVLIGLLPALRSSDPRLAATLAGGSAGAGSYRSPLRWGLTLTQGALSALLLVGAGLFVHSLWNIQRLDIGIHPDPVLQLSMDWMSIEGRSADAQGAEDERRKAVIEEALERVRSMPGVASAALGEGTPFRSAFWAYPQVPGYDSLPAMPGGGPYMIAVSEGYFETMGTRIVRGRPIEAGDVKGAERVVVVNETMARTLWPAGDAIGQCFVVQRGNDKQCSRVVGVAMDTPRFELRDEPAFQIYLSRRQAVGASTMLVRAVGDPAVMVPALRGAILQLDPTLLDVQVKLLRDALAPQFRPWRLGAMLFALFGVLALLVAAVGLYSVMSYTAASRTREMGVRLALGAGPGRIRWLVLRQGLLLGTGGVLVGLLLAVAGGRWAAPMLFGTSPREPVVLVVVLLALLAVTLLASAVPAWRVSRVPPVVALRE